MAEINTGEMLKTKMCKSVEEGRRCANGESCRFAHTIEQLTIKDCIFRDKCTFVCHQEMEDALIYTNNNTKQKICQFLHPREALENYLSRTNTGKPSMPSLLRGSTKSSVQSPMTHTKASENGSWTRIVRKVVKHPNLHIIDLGNESSDSICENSENRDNVIRVPRHVVESAFRTIFESGKTGIRLEIV